MEKFAYLFIHLGIPLIIVLRVLTHRPASKLGLVTGSALSLSVIGFLYLWGQWPLVGSYYFRYILLLILLLIVIKVIRGLSTETPLLPNKKLRYLPIGLSGLLALFLFTMVGLLLQGRQYPDDGIDLHFPFKNGTYYISSGGSNKLVNNHIRAFPTAQHFALDFNKLGPYGGAFKGFLSPGNGDHHIYADTVFCPCNGVIIEMENAVVDHGPSMSDVDAKDGQGNFLMIDCKGVFVSLVHLKQHSIWVGKRQVVKAGDPLGLIGNSGFSQEPHLHLQAAVLDVDSSWIGIPIRFDGEYFSRNDLISN